MVMENAGITAMLNQLIATGGYTASNTRIGVGDGNGSVPTAAASDTGLAAPTNRYFQLVSGSTPSVSGQVVTFQAVFASGNANFAWNEWEVDNGTTSGTSVLGTSLNHKGVSLGTKSSGSAWTMTSTITES